MNFEYKTELRAAQRPDLQLSPAQTAEVHSRMEAWIDAEFRLAIRGAAEESPQRQRPHIGYIDIGCMS